MKIIRISGHDAYGTKIAMACVVAGLERQARAVLSVTGDSTTDDVLVMCCKPVPFAIALHDYDPAGAISLEELASEPSLQKVICFVEQQQMPNDDISDVLPISVETTNVLRLVSASAGILSRAADSEGGDHD